MYLKSFQLHPRHPASGHRLTAVPAGTAGADWKAGGPYRQAGQVNVLIEPASQTQISPLA